jgi:AAA domain
LTGTVVKAPAEVVDLPVDGNRQVASPAEALETARVDLVELIRTGIPEREYVAGTCFLIRGKRHLFPAPAGDGKSLAALVVAVDVVEAGGTVVILDVENGQDEYARRLEDVLAARDDQEGTLAAACVERLRYHAFPALRMTWAAEDWASAVAGADLVVFDSSRLVLSGAGLAEDKSDDYATFANGLLVPLSRAGVATVVLDNTGHQERDRARGTKAKDDLNEVVYTVKIGKPFDRDRSGHVRLVRGRTRFPDLPGELHVPLGGGTYGPAVEAEPARDSTGFRPTGQMERASRAIERQPGLSKHAVETLVPGKTDYVRLALELLVTEGYVRADSDGQAMRHHSIHPYRESEAE